MLSNEECVREFVNGATSGKCNRMAIIEGPREYAGNTPVPEGCTALVGYDWAVYAIRTSNGRVNIHTGWSEWAMEQRDNGGTPTTVNHINLIRREAGPHAISTIRRPQLDREPGSTREICSA